MIAKAWWFSIAIGIALLGLTWWWAQQTQPVKLVMITVSAEAPHRLPVYAQFDVTQTMRLAKPNYVTKIDLPITMPSQPMGELLVELRANDYLLQRWQIPLAAYTAQANQTVTINLPLSTPALLAGKLELGVADPQLDAHFPELAPQVLIEDNDQGYPDGNYRIAQNEKKGDMSLIVWATQSNWSLLVTHDAQHPLTRLIQISRLAVMVLLLLMFPWLWQRSRASG